MNITIAGIITSYLCTMKTLFILPMLLITFSFSACKNNASGEAEEKEHHDAPSAITLNNGAKWIANPETTTGIKNMQSICAGYTGEASALPAVSAALINELSGIFDKCTMTGEAHENLHAYLLPLRDQLNLLADCKGSCTAEVEHVSKYLETYFHYFE